MNWIKVYERLTRKYNADCSELDDWSDNYIEYATIGNQTVETEEDGCYNGYEVVRTKGNLTEEYAFKFLQEEFRRGCSCEHDCCGHYHGGLDKVIKIADDKFLLCVSYCPNY